MSCSAISPGSWLDAAAKSKIQAALEYGHGVMILHVHRAFGDAVGLVVKRAVENGRVVTLDNMAVTHFRSAETLFKLAREFAGQIRIRVLKLSIGQPPHVITLDELAATKSSSIDQLRKMAHRVIDHEFGRLKSENAEILEALLKRDARR